MLEKERSNIILVKYKIKEGILNSELMNTDATISRCENKNVCVRTHSTDKSTLLIAKTSSLSDLDFLIRELNSYDEKYKKNSFLIFFSFSYKLLYYYHTTFFY